jgi:hypothetical protein
MTPGPATDSLVARSIWKAIIVTETETGESYMVNQDDYSKVKVPPYSTSVDEAHRIVEYFQNQGWSARIRNVPEQDVFMVSFFKHDGRTYRFMKGDTLPMAICMAALDLINGSNTIA